MKLLSISAAGLFFAAFLAPYSSPAVLPEASGLALTNYGKIGNKADGNLDFTLCIQKPNIQLCAHAEGSVGPFKFTKDLDVCAEVKKNAGTTCPIASGNNQKITVSVPLPDIKISVAANLMVNVVNSDKSQLFCFKTKVQIKP
ncbi:hypothetical protein BDF19DRAFT_433570 [Syncephalis fuscata]|nr:hypothetical protein BDF19DRAFT_433570 [Syncephalis fuscata]